MPPPKDVLERRCSHCGKRKFNLNKCAGCKAVMYCDQKHQRAHWPTHKVKCSAISVLEATLDKEETALRNLPPDDFTPANVFETSVGHFWGIHETRPYMKAKFDVAYALQQMTSRLAVKESLFHLMDMLRLSRGDNLGVRDYIPALELRLKKDQDAYDFLKWYATNGDRPDYDWGDMSLPFLNLKDEDVMEDIRFFKSRYQVAHAIALTLIKLRILLDLIDLHNSVQASSAPPSSQRSGIWNKRPWHGVPNLEQLIERLQKQVTVLFEKVTSGNSYFWAHLLNHQRYMMLPLSTYGMGSPEHAILMVQATGRAWIETEGALGWVRTTLRARSG